MGLPIGLDLSQGLPLPPIGGGSLSPIAPNMGSTPSWLSQLSPLATPTNALLGGLSGAAGAMPTSGTSTTNGTTSGKSEYSNEQNVVLSPENQALLSQLSNQYSHLAATGTNLQPYQQQGVQQINSNSQMASKAAMEALASRGLSTSPVAGNVAASQEGNRIAQITQFQNGIPLLQNQMNLQNFGQASQFAASLPHGMSSSGDSSNSTTSNSTTKTSSGGGVGGFLGGLGKAVGAAAGIAGMFSDERLKENVSSIKDGLKNILKLEPKDYNFIGEKEKTSGFMAQQLEAIFPDSVDSSHPSGFKKVKYFELIPKIVSAMKELNEKVERRAA